MIKLFILSILIFSFACSGHDTNKEKPTRAASKFSYPAQPLLIENGEEEGNTDIRLSLTEITLTDTLSVYKAISTYRGKNVGLEFVLPCNREGVDNSPLQTLMVKSCGQSSDDLLLLLSNLYSVNIDETKHFTDSVKLSFVDLNEFAKAKFGKDAIQQTDAKEMKLFFEPGDPEEYAELYVSINDKEHWLEIIEKDKDYREPIIKFLTAQPGSVNFH